MVRLVLHEKEEGVLTIRRLEEKRRRWRERKGEIRYLFLRDWRKSIIVSIFKKSDKERTEKYREAEYFYRGAFDDEEKKRERCKVYAILSN